MNRPNTEKGFTLIELIIVLVIIGILAAGFVIYTRGVQTQASVRADIAMLQSIAGATKAACQWGTYDIATRTYTPLATANVVTQGDINSYLGVNFMDSATTIAGNPDVVVTLPADCAAAGAVLTLQDSSLGNICTGPGAPYKECNVAGNTFQLAL